MAVSPSNATYWAEGSWQAYYATDWNCNTDVTLSNERGVAGFLPGFDVSYDEGKGVDTRATLQKVELIYALSKGMVTSFTVTSGSWRYEGRRYPDYLYLQDGSRRYIGRDFEVHLFTFTGPMSNKVVVEAERQSWPGSIITATGQRNYYCTGSGNIPIYAGYLMSFSTETGFRVTDGNIIRSGVMGRS